MIGPVYPYRGGIAHYTTLLAQALTRGGHELQLVSFSRQYPAFLYPGQSDRDPSNVPLRVAAEYLLDPLYPWTWQRSAAAILAKLPDIVLIHWWSTFWAPAYSALAHRLNRYTPVVFLIHNVLPHETRPWDRWLARLALRQGSAFIVQAPHEQEKLTNLIPGARVSYCNLPIYERFSDEVIPKSAARRQLGLPADQPLFLFFGIVRPYKGLRYLVDAMAKIDIPVHLVIAGEFWEDVASYQNQVEKLGLGGKVTFLNKYIPNEEAHVLFSAADVLVAPYVDGTQSAAVGVSLGYELPTIVTEKIAAGIDRDTRGVHVVPTADSAGLARLMTELAHPHQLPATPAQLQSGWQRLVAVIEQLSVDLSSVRAKQISDSER